MLKDVIIPANGWDNDLELTGGGTYCPKHKHYNNGKKDPGFSRLCVSPKIIYRVIVTSYHGLSHYTNKGT